MTRQRHQWFAEKTSSAEIAAYRLLLRQLLEKYDQPDTSDGPEADALWARARVLVGGGR